MYINNIHQRLIINAKNPTKIDQVEITINQRLKAFGIISYDILGRMLQASIDLKTLSAILLIRQYGFNIPAPDERVWIEEHRDRQGL